MHQLLAFCLSCAVVSVAWCVILVDSGMLLEPVQRWLRDGYRARYSDECRMQVADLDTRWWWKPLWGCYRCNSVWWALLGYPLAFPAYSPWLHLVSVCATLFLACILNALYQWSQTK